jgi:hypothetical protein
MRGRRWLQLGAVVLAMCGVQACSGPVEAGARETDPLPAEQVPAASEGTDTDAGPTPGTPVDGHAGTGAGADAGADSGTDAGTGAAEVTPAAPWTLRFSDIEPEGASRATGPAGELLLTRAQLQHGALLGDSYHADREEAAFRCVEGDVVHAGEPTASARFEQVPLERLVAELGYQLPGRTTFAAQNGTLSFARDAEERLLERTVLFRYVARGRTARLAQPRPTQRLLALRAADPVLAAALCGSDFVQSIETGGELWVRARVFLRDAADLPAFEAFRQRAQDLAAFGAGLPALKAELVTLGYAQFGGDVLRIGGILAGEGETPLLPFCTPGTHASCATQLARAERYAREDFRLQVAQALYDPSTPGGGTAVRYGMQTYAAAGLSDVGAQARAPVPADVEAARGMLRAQHWPLARDLRRADSLLSGPLTSADRAQVAAVRAKVAAASLAVTHAGTSCYAVPAQCVALAQEAAAVVEAHRYAPGDLDVTPGGDPE